MWSLNMVRPRRPSQDRDYRAGRVAANMLRLRDLGVIAPNQALYYPYQRSYLRGDASRVGEGVAKIEWIFDVSDIQELRTLMTIFFDAVTDTFAHNRFIRTDLRTGDKAKPSQAFANYQVTVWRPELFGPDGLPVANSVMAVETVRFTFTNLVGV